MKNQRGFTMLELMIVISIAGILLTMAQPSFQLTMHKARETALKQNLFTMRDVIDQYRADVGHYPTSLDELTTSGYLKRIPADPFTKSTSLWQEIRDQADGGIFDIHSGSDLASIDGTPYNLW